MAGLLRILYRKLHFVAITSADANICCSSLHTLPPSSIYLAHLMPFLEEHTTLLNAQLAATQDSNTELLSTITAQRAEIETLVRSLEDVTRDLETSAQMMGQDSVQGLSKEIRELETEMKK